MCAAFPADETAVVRCSVHGMPGTVGACSGAVPPYERQRGDVLQGQVCAAISAVSTAALRMCVRAQVAGMIAEQMVAEVDRQQLAAEAAAAQVQARASP